MTIIFFVTLFDSICTGRVTKKIIVTLNEKNRPAHHLTQGRCVKFPILRTIETYTGMYFSSRGTKQAVRKTFFARAKCNFARAKKIFLPTVQSQGVKNIHLKVEKRQFLPSEMKFVFDFLTFTRFFHLYCASDKTEFTAQNFTF